MKLKEALDTYMFDNVGQFGGIAESLGYKTEYRDGYFRFRKDGEEFSMSVGEIREKARAKEDETLREQSKERVANIFDKERANDPRYVAELEKEGISIKRWENLKENNKDGFTVIDHRLKVCYTGQALYEYAYRQGNILDGKGTKLEKGIMSDLMEINDKPGKLRFSDNGISLFYRKEALVIPDKVLGKKLSKKEKEQLLAGNVVPINAKKKDVLLQVDRDLNSVIVRTNHEIKIPDVIGKTNEYEGYKLTKADKFLLANGHTLESKLLHSPDGYFIADIRLTDDMKGVMILNIQSITPTKAQELIKAMTPKLEAHAVSLETKENREHGEQRNMDLEFKEAVGKQDFEKIEKLKEEGYKPSEEFIKGIGKEHGLDERQTQEVIQLFGTRPEEQAGRKKQAERLLEAAQTSNFHVIQEIQKDGYQLSQQDLTRMREAGVQSNTLIAVQKIFGMEGQNKTLGDVKLASTPKPDNSKEIARPIASTINRAFNDL